MPTVPRFEEPQVQERALPSARFTPPSDIASFGGGQSTQRVVNSAISYLQEEKKKADDVATTEAYAKLSRFNNDLVYNQNDGVMTKRGKDAFGAFDEFGSRFDKGADEIEKTLSNEEQKAVFRNIRSKQRMAFENTLQKHVFQESRRFDEETTNAALSASLDDAVKNYQEPGKIQENIELQKALIASNAQRNGLPKEVVENQIAEVESKTHAAVIERMLTNDQDQLAKEYFNDIKKDMTGSDTVQVEKSLEAGTLRGESQRKTDEIMESATTVTEGLAKAREIKDTKLRDQVVSRVKSRFSELKALEKQELDQNYLSAYEYVQQSPTSDPLDVIPPSLFSKLSADQKTALYKLQTPGTDDANTWTSFTSLSPREIGALSLSDLQTNYWSGMNQEHRKQAVDLWNTAKKNVEDQKLNGFLSEKAQIKNTLISSGLYDVNKPKEEQKERLVAFENSLNKSFQEFERLKGRKPDPQEFQKLIDDQLTKKVFIEDGGFAFFDKEKLLVEVSEDERKDAYVPLKQIPQSAVDRIKGMAKQRGRTLTKSKLEKIYAAALLGDDDRVQELIGR